MIFSAYLRRLGALYLRPNDNSNHNLSLLYRFMRFSLFVVFLSLISMQMLWATSSDGQNIGNTYVTLGLDHESLETAIKKIEHQTPFRFYYRKADIKALNNLAMASATGSVEQALQQLLSNTNLSFRQIDENILIEKQAQQISYEVKGRVLSSSRQPVDYATVMLRKIDSGSPLQQTLTDSGGLYKFNIREKGDYLVIVSAVGMDSLSVSFNLSSQRVITLTDLILPVKTTTLQAVTVIGTMAAHRGLIEQKIDRLVYNVKNSAASQGMSGLDVLRTAPMVMTQDNEISIVGKSGVSVMVNDRMINLSGSELTNYLQSLRSDDIEKIEIITTPPSKYDAQGNSGIINIILKKNPNFGWSGSLNASYERSKQNGGSSGATLNFNSEKLSSSLKLRQYSNGYNPIGTRDLLTENQNMYTNEQRKDRTYGLGLNFSVDYKVSNKSNIGAIYDFEKSNYNIDSYNGSRYESHSIVDSVLNTASKQRWKTPTHTVNLYYDLKLDTSGKKVSFTGNYLGNRPDKGNDFSTLNSATNVDYIVRNNSILNYKVYSGQVDITLPYKWSNIETGLKYTKFDNNSDVSYYNYVNQDYVIDPANSNVFNYDEKNYAGYISLNRDFNSRWSAKAGLRYEYTDLEGRTPGNETDIIKNNYGKLFPSAYISYKPNNNHVFSLNYSKRINRPNFQSLNPFRWYTNPFTYYTGTPSLQPSFNDNIEISYSFKSKFNASIYNQYTSGGYNSVARFSDGIYSSVTLNSFNQNRTGLNISYYNTFLKKWELSVNANGSFTRVDPTIPELQKLEVYSLRYSFYNTIAINGNRTYFLLLNFWHSLPFSYGNTYLHDQLSFSPGVKVSLFKNSLQGNLILSDAFKTIKNTGYVAYAGYQENFTQYNDYRRITLSLTHSFGNKKVKGNNKKVKFEDSERAH